MITVFCHQNVHYSGILAHSHQEIILSLTLYLSIYLSIYPHTHLLSCPGLISVAQRTSDVTKVLKTTGVELLYIYIHDIYKYTLNN